MHDERNFKLIGCLLTVIGLVTFITGLWMRSGLDGIKGVTHTFGHSLIFVAVSALAAAISFFIGKKYGAAVYNTVAFSGIVLAIVLVGGVRLMELKLLGSNVDLIVSGIAITGTCLLAAAFSAFGVVAYQNNENTQQ